MLTPDEALCRECRYPLKGLTTPRCPECGTGFDPLDPQTIAPTMKRSFFWQAAASGFCLLCFGMSMPGLGTGPHRMPLMVRLVPIVLSIAFMMGFSLSGVRMTRGWHRYLCAFLFAIGLWILILGLLPFAADLYR